MFCWLTWSYMFMKSAYTCLCPRICINGVQTLTGRSKIRENHFQIHYVILKQAGDWCVGGAPSLKVDFSNLPQKPSPGTQKKWDIPDIPICWPFLVLQHYFYHAWLWYSSPLTFRTRICMCSTVSAVRWSGHARLHHVGHVGFHHVLGSWIRSCNYIGMTVWQLKPWHVQARLELNLLWRRPRLQHDHGLSKCFTDSVIKPGSCWVATALEGTMSTSSCSTHGMRLWWLSHIIGRLTDLSLLKLVQSKLNITLAVLQQLNCPFVVKTTSHDQTNGILLRLSVSIKLGETLRDTGGWPIHLLHGLWPSSRAIWPRRQLLDKGWNMVELHCVWCLIIMIIICT